MHSKEKGNIGELAVACDLIKKGYAVFTELGDNSRVDLIALKQNAVIKIQVKYLTEKNGSVKVSRRKSSRGYEYLYSYTDFDYFAVYNPDRDIVIYIPMKYFSDNAVKRELTVRFEESKNNQKIGIVDYRQFLEVNI